MVTLDGCAGVMVYLSAQCVADDTAIVSSKCSEINVVLPAKAPAEPAPRAPACVHARARRLHPRRTRLPWRSGLLCVGGVLGGTPGPFILEAAAGVP